MLMVKNKFYLQQMSFINFTTPPPKTKVFYENVHRKKNKNFSFQSAIDRS